MRQISPKNERITARMGVSVASNSISRAYRLFCQQYPGFEAKRPVIHGSGPLPKSKHPNGMGKYFRILPIGRWQEHIGSNLKNPTLLADGEGASDKTLS
jgi:hypothetical protein